VWSPVNSPVLRSSRKFAYFSSSILDLTSGVLLTIETFETGL
jgi:hypothetical protein